MTNNTLQLMSTMLTLGKHGAAIVLGSLLTQPPTVPATPTQTFYAAVIDHVFTRTDLSGVADAETALTFQRSGTWHEMMAQFPSRMQPKCVLAIHYIASGGRSIKEQLGLLIAENSRLTVAEAAARVTSARDTRTIPCSGKLSRLLRRGLQH